MTNQHLTFRHQTILFIASSFLAALASAQEFPGEMQFEGAIGDAKIYAIHFQQTMQGTNGNWVVDDKGACKMPPDLKIKGTITLSLKANRKTAKATMKITGQKTVNKTVALQTDSGINLSLGQYCLVTFPSLPAPKPSETETKQLVDDALAAPTPQKLYRLAQLK